jgi:hypothetical protein
MSYVDRRRALDTRGRRRVSASGRNWGGGNGRHFLDAAGKTGSGRGSGIASTCSNSRGGHWGARRRGSPADGRTWSRRCQVGLRVARDTR